MKKLLLIPIIIFFITCKKHKIEKNCCSQAHVDLRVDSAYVICPNIFTPNNNGINDYFKFYAGYVKSVTITFFDKSDKTIFTQSILTAHWDGKNTKGKIVEGNYRFTVDALSVSGKNMHADGEVAVIASPKDYSLKNMGACFFSDSTNGIKEHFKK